MKLTPSSQANRQGSRVIGIEDFVVLVLLEKVRIGQGIESGFEVGRKNVRNKPRYVLQSTSPSVENSGAMSLMELPGCSVPSGWQANEIRSKTRRRRSNSRRVNSAENPLKDHFAAEWRGEEPVGHEDIPVQLEARVVQDDVYPSILERPYVLPGLVEVVGENEVLCFLLCSFSSLLESLYVGMRQVL